MSLYEGKIQHQYHEEFNIFPYRSLVTTSNALFQVRRPPDIHYFISEKDLILICRKRLNKS